jgi:hypothetical protein
MLSPVAIIGAVVGYKGTKKLPEQLFYRLVEVALFLISLKLIYDALLR